MQVMFIDQIIQIIIIIAAFLIAITVHEFSHAFAAYKLGDRTARDAGRLTLNPLAHIDLIGLLFLLLFRIGWAKPVPMNSNNFKYPRFYSVIAGLAGPFSNFICAIFFIYGLKRIMPFYEVEFQQQYFALEFFKLSAYVNVMLGVFNLLPIPPLDGSHLLYAFIPKSWQRTYYRLQFISIIILLILLMIPQFQLFLIKSISMTYNFLQELIIGKSTL